MAQNYQFSQLKIEGNERIEPATIIKYAGIGRNEALSAGGRDTGYTLGGVAWYRKHFTTPDSLTEGAVATLTFDGAHMRSWPRILIT